MTAACQGSSVHRILQARILESVAISFFRGSSQPRSWTGVSCVAGGFFTSFNSWVGKIPWRRNRLLTPVSSAGGSAGKESTCNAGDLGSIPGLGRSCGEGKSYSLQYSSLENSIDCIFHGAAKIQIRQSFTFTFLYQLSYTEVLTGAVLWLICSQTTFWTIWHFAHTLTQTARPLSFCSACISCILYSFYKCLLDNPKRSDVCCRYSDKHKREEFYSHGVIGL